MKIKDLGRYMWFIIKDDGNELVYNNEETFEKLKVWWQENKDYKFNSAIRRN